MNNKLSFEDRAVAAFMGLAVGDAYGAPLEFLTGEEVRTKKVDTSNGKFMWTDDTHMALYVAQAIQDMKDNSFENGDDDVFGHSVGKQFLIWLNDPLMPSTAPGMTCLSGTENYRDCGDWRISGRKSSGCGAVMRIAPIPMAFSGEELTRAAEISAMVTHNAGTAKESAIAACHLLRALLVGGSISENWVKRVIKQLEGQWSRGGSAAKSLKDALKIAATDSVWLDESAVHPGDGGWAAHSALGLAVAAVLKWHADPMIAIDKAARINGDSDSVACLVGMFLGAAYGISAFPKSIIDSVPRRETIENFARLLSKRAEGFSKRAPQGVERTSANIPIIAPRVTNVGEKNGSINITFCPGKQDGYRWHRDLAIDLDQLSSIHEIDVLVCLIEDHEMDFLNVPDLVRQANSRGIEVIRYPIVDVDIPTDEKVAIQIADKAIELARGGANVAFHCRGGLGRAGTMTALALRRLGWSAEDAISVVREKRPGAIETRQQEKFVRNVMV